MAEELDSKQMSDVIDQQYVFDRLPLNKQQRESFYRFMCLPKDKQDEFLLLEHERLEHEQKQKSQSVWADGVSVPVLEGLPADIDLVPTW